MIPGVMYWGKLPVPFVAGWSSENAIRIAPDPYCERRPAVFRDGRRGRGTPLFGKMDESRTRHVIARRMCQVCAGGLGAAGYIVDTIKGSVGRDPLLTEPLACVRCFREAIALCPGIARMRDNPCAIVVRCTAYQMVVAMVKPLDGGDEELNKALRRWKGEPPLGYGKYAPVDYDVLPMAWLDSADVRGVA